MHEISCSHHLQTSVLTAASWTEILPTSDYGCYMVTCLITVVLTNDNELTLSAMIILTGSPPFLSLLAFPFSCPFLLLGRLLTQTIWSIFSTITISFSRTPSTEVSLLLLYAMLAILYNFCVCLYLEETKSRNWNESCWLHKTYFFPQLNSASSHALSAEVTQFRHDRESFTGKATVS